MTLNNFTIKSQEAVQKAQEIATSLQHQSIESAHILKGILAVDEHVTPYLLKKMEVNTPRLSQQVDAILSSLPRVSGGGQYLSNDANQALVKASQYATKMNDEFVSIEPLLLGLLDGRDQVGPKKRCTWPLPTSEKVRKSPVKVPKRATMRSTNMPRTSTSWPNPANSTPSSAAMKRFAACCKYSVAAPRTTPSSSVNPVWEKQLLPKALPIASSVATFRRI